MTEFITRNHGNRCFEIIIKTTNPEHYKATQDFARCLIDHTKPVTDANVGSKWIPVTERFPDKATDYLCRCIVNDDNTYPFYMVLRYIMFHENPHFQHETKGGMKVTHWMPMPEPPQEE